MEESEFLIASVDAPAVSTAKTAPEVGKHDHGEVMGFVENVYIDINH